jgi:hypothetical protein
MPLLISHPFNVFLNLLGWSDRGANHAVITETAIWEL